MKSERGPWPLVLACVVVAAFFRFWRLDEIPIGLGYDEAFEGLDALAMIRDGSWPVFLPGNFGREPLQAWLLSIGLRFGPAEPLTLRATSAVVGTLTVPAAFLMGRALFSTRIGLLTALATAISFWQIVPSRIAVRPIVLPIMLCLVFWLLARAIKSGRVRDYLPAGLALGLSAYSYTPVRLLPLILAVAGIGWFFVDRKRVRAHLVPVCIGLIAAIAVVAPLLNFFRDNPEAFLGRISQVAVTSASSVGGESASENALKTLGMVLVDGDQQIRTNVPGRPILDPAFGAAFLIGLGIALTGRAGPIGRLVLLWLVVLALPSALSVDAPHYARAFGIAPAICLLVAFGLDGIVRLAEWRRPHPLREGEGTTFTLHPSPFNFRRFAGALVILSLAGYSAWSTSRDLFDVWGEDPATFVGFDAGLADLGLALRDIPRDVPIFLSPLPGDHAVVRFMSRRSDVRGYDGRAGYILPAGGPAAYGIVVKDDRITEPGLGDAYRGVGPIAVLMDPFGQPYSVVTRVEGPAAPPAGRQVHACYEATGCLAAVRTPAQLEGRSLAVVLVWRAGSGSTQRLIRSVQLLGPSRPDGSRIWAQDDSEPVAGSVPTTSWRPGEAIVEQLTLDLPAALPAGEYSLVIRLYDRQTQRPVAATGADAIGETALIARWIR